jgi:hypothetical protein
VRHGWCGPGDVGAGAAPALLPPPGLGPADRLLTADSGGILPRCSSRLQPAAEREHLQASPPQFQIAAMLLGELTRLIDSGGIRKGGGDAPLLPATIQRGQRRAQT